MVFEFEPDIWYDFNNQLKDDTKLQGFDKSIRAKCDEDDRHPRELDALPAQ